MQREAADAALVAGDYDKAAVAALLNMAASTAGMAQTAEDLVDAFTRYLVLGGRNRPIPRTGEDSISMTADPLVNRLGDQLEPVHMTGPDHREIPAVQGRQYPSTEVLGHGHHTRIDYTETEIGIGVDQLRTPLVVDGPQFDDLELARRHVAQERRLRRRPDVALDLPGALRDHRRRHPQLPRFSRSNRAHTSWSSSSASAAANSTPVSTTTLTSLEQPVPR